MRLSAFQKPPDLRHLQAMTTNFGVIQHAKFDQPDPTYGYSIDDQARALIVCIWYGSSYNENPLNHLITTYFNFLANAQTTTGEFHNFFSFNGQPLDERGSPDSFGRTLWALAETITHSPDQKLRESAKKIWLNTKTEGHLRHRHLRTKAYLALANASLADKSGSQLWADELMKLFAENSTDDWCWFEPALIYCNAIPIYALTRAYEVLGEKKYLTTAEKTFSWLNSVSRIDNIVAPIGQNGWYHKANDKAHYDQQPVDTAKMVLAAQELFKVTKNKHYLDTALEWMNWYAGHNTNSRSLIDEKSGGIYDALTPTGINENEGAESIITYLMAYISLAEIDYD